MRNHRYKNKSQLLIILLVVGFIIGIIYENIVSKNQVVITNIFIKSNLQRYLQTNVVAEKYFWYVFKNRLLLLFIIIILSGVKWKKAFVTLCLLIIGFFAGIFCVASVLQLGSKGLLLCFAGLFPQMLFYCFVYGMLFTHWFYVPEKQWNRTKTLFIIVALTIGILLEIYVNPIIVKFVIGIL